MKTLEQIRQEGFQALLKTLGAVGRWGGAWANGEGLHIA